ncbi:serralysin [Palleronia aestuarii]|uniref:Serralysin n=1 Tax=Palleronia aestuarii TaxID=568105 RepID=A0A2W7NQB8_9RHOB|nr:M10 family metallopeptidase C-terminal domain-containing protein [Palleronia aestuarii]PZX13482.1 serralysin [Palleronia aestuarii]
MPIATAARSIPLADLDTLARYQTDGYWEDRGAVRHAFVPSNSNVVTVDLTGLGAGGTQLARWAFEAWERVADISFREVAGGADITFTNDRAGGEGGVQYNPVTGETFSADVNVGAEWLQRYGTTIDSYAFSTYLHEIGHALGLGHQGDYDIGAEFSDATFANDSWQLSVMSYFSQEENPNVGVPRAELITPMQADIVAIQDLYGASTVTRGATVWGVGSDGTLGAVFAALGGADRPRLYEGDTVALTIFDAGGRDVLDLSNSTAGDRIDLAPGTFSDIYGGEGNLAITRDTILEAVRAGSGSDTIFGNGARNALFGNGGNDAIWGRGGHDLARGGGGQDTIGGGAGDDALYGGAGGDVLYGGGGDDTQGGGGGNDLVYGRDGDDLLFGAAGDDSLYGDGGRDTLYGGSGRDALGGGGEADMIYGGGGNDVLFGAAGDDSLYGDGGRDTLYGGAGRDALGGGGDADRIYGGGGADTLFGAAGNDRLLGQGGNDRIFGGGGNDLLSGGGGRDVLVGGAGADVFVFAGGGRDRIVDFSRAEDDRLHLAPGLGEDSFDDAAALVLDVARIVSGDIVLDFGAAGVLVVEDFTDIAGLALQTDFL